jgi:hypothetical protein
MSLLETRDAEIQDYGAGHRRGPQTHKTRAPTKQKKKKKKQRQQERHEWSQKKEKGRHFRKEKRVGQVNQQASSMLVGRWSLEEMMPLTPST